MAWGPRHVRITSAMACNQPLLMKLLLTNLNRMKTHILIGGDVNSKFDVIRDQPS
ncbi:hypothetical protein J6590_095728, partial [Homalodisca vitripennis]